MSSARIYFGAWCFLISAETVTAQPGTKALQMHTLDNCPVLDWPCCSAVCALVIADSPGPQTHKQYPHFCFHLTFIFSLHPLTVLKLFRFFMTSYWIWLERFSKFDNMCESVLCVFSLVGHILVHVKKQCYTKQAVILLGCLLFWLGTKKIFTWRGKNSQLTQPTRASWLK